MAYESSGTEILDEIDRLFVVYDKAKDYITKILTGIDEQIGLWQFRRQIIQNQTKSTTSFDFLLPKTQRINELTIDAVQALCRVDILIEQVQRIDPKSLTQARSIPPSTSFSARSIDTNISHPITNTVLSHTRQPTSSPSASSMKQTLYSESISNGKPFGQQTSYPMPVLRTQRSTNINAQETSGFKPIEQHQHSSIISDSTPRPTPIHPQTSQYSTHEKTTSSRPVTKTYGKQTPQPGPMSPPRANQSARHTASNVQPPRDKVKVKLQRIPPGTKWKKAKIDVIDSLSAFYVENLDPRVRDSFLAMLEDLHDYYNDLEQQNNLHPLENIAVGDFGVAKYSEDDRWYRARFLMLEEQDQIRIVFIDFGNIETKHIHEFFPLDKLYTDLPAQAIACSLSEAFPPTQGDTSSFWPPETVQIFREEVTEKEVEVTFANAEEGTEKWPLHFVRITVGNQTVTSLLNLKQRIEPRPNRFIAEHLEPSLTLQEYILFNVPIGDEYDQ